MPAVNLEDTIAAVSTPPGEGAVAVLRVSGKQALPLVSLFFHPTQKGDLAKHPTHTIHHGHFVDEQRKGVDEVLVSLFRAPHSYTGEEVVEISCHGGMRIASRILELLVRRGARHAEPGEFTKRAFLNGKMDLTQAEAVLDLIRAKSEVSIKTAIGQLQGALSEKIRHLKEALLKIQAHLEAGLDFPDERLEVDSREECLMKILGVEDEIRALVRSFKRGAALREGILTVIVGRPNVGKSSLLNSLLAKERALVSKIPGTTRDALEETVEIGGFGLRLVDTAGLALAPKDELDQMSMERTQRYLKEGDLFLFMIDGSSPWTAEDEAILTQLREKNFLPLVNKIDLAQKLTDQELQRHFFKIKPSFISCLSGLGLLELESRIEERLRQDLLPQESLILTRLRHKQAFEKALESLEVVKRGLEEAFSSELILVDLKVVLDSLQELIGEIYSEDLLDVIFQEFCIGK